MCLDILGNTGNIPTHRGPAALSPRWFACARLMTFVWTPIIHLHYRIGGRAWIPTRGRFFIAVSHAGVASVAVTRGRVTVRRFVCAVGRLYIRGGGGAQPMGATMSHTQHFRNTTSCARLVVGLVATMSGGEWACRYGTRVNNTSVVATSVCCQFRLCVGSCDVV